MLAPWLSLLVSVPVSAPVSPPLSSPPANNATVQLWSCGCASSCCSSPAPALQFIRLATHCSRLHAASFISGATFCYKTLFSICAHITQLATPLFRYLPLPFFLPVCVCSTYLAFVFIFSVIVLFLPCHGNSCSSSCLAPSPSPIPRLRPCVHATYHLWIRTVHSPRQAHAVDYYYEHYDRISLTAQNVSCASCCW